MSGLDSKPCQVCGNYYEVKHIFTMCKAHYYEAQKRKTAFTNHTEEILALIIINYDNFVICFIKPN